MSTQTDRELRWIPLTDEDLPVSDFVLPTPFPERPESDFSELTSSIRLHGVIVPVLLRRTAAGLQIVCGYRRYLAAKAAGLQEIPAQVTRMTDVEAVRSFLAEGMIRRPLSPQLQESALGRLRDLRDRESADVAEDPSTALPSGTAPGKPAESGVPVADRRFTPQSRMQEVGGLGRRARAASGPGMQAARQLIRATRELFEDINRRRAIDVEATEQLAAGFEALMESVPDLDSRFWWPGRDRKDVIEGHSLLVTQWCWNVAVAERADDESRRTLVLAGLLHDVGMVFVRELGVERGMPLTKKERQTLQGHARIGCALLTGIAAWSEEVALAARDHHERHDGSGYPAGRMGDEICDIAHLVAIVDSYGAMISPRAHRDALEPWFAWERLRKATELGLYDTRAFRRVQVALEARRAYGSLRSQEKTFPELPRKSLDPSRPLATMSAEERG